MGLPQKLVCDKPGHAAVSMLACCPEHPLLSRQPPYEAQKEVQLTAEVSARQQAPSEVYPLQLGGTQLVTVRVIVKFSLSSMVPLAGALNHKPN